MFTGFYPHLSAARWSRRLPVKSFRLHNLRLMETQAVLHVDFVQLLRTTPQSKLPMTIIPTGSGPPHLSVWCISHSLLTTSLGIGLKSWSTPSSFGCAHNFISPEQTEKNDDLNLKTVKALSHVKILQKSSLRTENQ